jgi:ATP-binding cassette subfamily B multidrug efflux pump
MSDSMPTRPSAGVREAFQPRRPGAVGRIEKPVDPRQALARLYAYLHPHKAALMLVMAGVLVYTALGLVGPYLMGVAIDRFIMTKQATGLAPVALGMLAAYLLGNLCQAFCNWGMASVSQRALQQLRRDLFVHLQALPLAFFDRHPAGELMSRLTNDIDAINQTVSQNVTALLASVLSMAGILAAMFVLDAWLALAALLVVPILFGFTRFVARYTRRGFRDLQQGLGRLNAVMEESISGQKVIQAFGRSAAVVADFQRHNAAVFQTGVVANSYALLMMPLMTVLGNFFIIVVTGLGGWLALQGLVSVGIIATFITYAQNFIQPMRQLANIYNAIQAALAGSERIFEIMDQPAESPGPPQAEGLPEIRGQVKFEHVHFAYEGSPPIVRDLTFTADAGQLLALVGPTGAGKTTIINLLTRFYEIEAGRVAVDGVDIRDMPRDALRRRLGLVLQDTFLFAETVMENIRFGRPEASDDECIQAARMADADHFIRQLPQGYQTNLAERAGNLSQGQRQLLAIARAILADPEILILDEATSSVDSRTEARIQQAILRFMARRTSLVIAHRLSTIRDADQVLVIDRGAIVESGTHQSLLARRGFYHQLYRSQFKGLPI